MGRSDQARNNKTLYDVDCPECGHGKAVILGWIPYVQVEVTGDWMCVKCQHRFTGV